MWIQFWPWYKLSYIFVILIQILFACSIAYNDIHWCAWYRQGNIHVKTIFEDNTIFLILLIACQLKNHTWDYILIECNIVAWIYYIWTIWRHILVAQMIYYTAIDSIYSSHYFTISCRIIFMAITPKCDAFLSFTVQCCIQSTYNLRCDSLIHMQLEV